MAGEVKTITAPKFTRLLGPDDPQPVVVENQGARSPYLLVCDHAGRTTPRCLDSLGLPAEAFDRHIACDIGAAALAGMIARRLDAWLARQTYSRLVIDCNRGPGHEGLIVEVSDETEIPGNIALAAAQAEARWTEIHRPYHAAIGAELDRRATAGLPTAVVSIHSFTPVFGGRPRPWQVGVLHAGDSAASQAMLGLLRAEPDLVVGDNQPYAMDGIDYTVPFHAMGRGLDYLELEVRQDLIAAPDGQAHFAERLGRLIPRALAGQLRVPGPQAGSPA